MKILNAGWVFVVALVFSIRVEAGVIPYSFIQDEAKSAKAENGNVCERLEKRHAEVLEKISDLRAEEEKYLKELDKMSGSYCSSGR